MVDDAVVRLDWWPRVGTPRRREPVTCGLPWPPGRLRDESRLRLTDTMSRPYPLQARVLDHWPDGSIRWCLLDWILETDGGGFELRLADGTDPPRSEMPLEVELLDGGRAASVDTGVARFRLGVGTEFPFEQAVVAGRSALDPARSGLSAVDAEGLRYRLSVERIELLEPGPLRASMSLEGALVSHRGGRLIEVGATLDFHAASAMVRCDLTLANPRAAGHPGGLWTLGSEGSVYLEDVSLRLALPHGGDGESRVRCSTEPGAALRTLALPFELCQESSGGENWRSRCHVNRHGEVPHSLRGYRLRAGGTEEVGSRATPVVLLERGEALLGVAMARFWQNFPKAVEATDEGLVLRLFPAQYGDFHELQGGERKTHRFHLACGEDRVSEPMLDWCREPLLVHASPEWYSRARAVPHLLPRTEGPSGGYQALVQAALDGDDTFADKSERVDEYGWRHFGDLYADHEAVHHDGPDPLVSHYNNQYDAVQGFAIQFLRSGDGRWFRWMDDLARHVVDIDTYHTDEDKSAYNHGQFWHTVHYVDAGRSTHRTYPAAEGVAGGGPSAGHLYTTGLLLHHLLTGDPRSRRAVVEAGNYVISADDGGKTIFRFLDRGPTGHVTSSASDDYHGPGRAPANALDALLAGARASGEARFVEKADEIVRRSVHPCDDPAAHRLEDVEERWFYTMFLCSLGRYLERKILWGENDTMYAYARASLLHYARWASRHEYPYLEKPEILEHPTETWAAQDMRKSVMFRFAARHAEDGEERRRFEERAGFFHRVSVDQLASMPTRTLCRPVVILLSIGYGQAFHERVGEQAAPAPAESLDGLGEPRTFVPQKQRAMRRLRLALLVAAALGSGLATLLLFGEGG